jgi:hypothetical protein
MSHEIDSIWYVYNNQTLIGPLSKSQIIHNIATDLFKLNDLIWKRGCAGWLTLLDWTSPGFDFGEGPNVAPESHFYLEIDGLHQGPFLKSELLVMFTKLKFTAQTKLWMEGLTAWEPFYDSIFLKELDIKLRVYLRVPIVGCVHFNDPTTKEDLNLSCAAISEGGITIQGWLDFKKDLITDMKIASPQLPFEIKAQARAVYQHGSEVGFEFVPLLVEQRLMLSSFVNLFHMQTSLSKQSNQSKQFQQSREQQSPQQWKNLVDRRQKHEGFEFFCFSIHPS